MATVGGRGYSSEQNVRARQREGFLFVSQRGSQVKYRKTGDPTFTVAELKPPPDRDARTHAGAVPRSARAARHAGVLLHVAASELRFSWRAERPRSVAMRRKVEKAR